MLLPYPPLLHLIKNVITGLLKQTLLQLMLTFAYLQSTEAEQQLPCLLFLLLQLDQA
jgi:hypothetical protein